MKTVKSIFFACTFIVLFSACSNYQMRVQIPSKEKLVLDYPNYETFMGKLQNRSLTSLDVEVVSKKDEKWVRSFGLDAMATEKIRVEQENHLILANNSNKNIKLRVSIEGMKRKETPVKKVYKSFTLQNKSAKSIPLIIPNVMNPNLSPFSKSGLDLKVGQEILFRVGVKKYILLTVDEKIKNGDLLNVGELLAQRKKELGL